MKNRFYIPSVFILAFIPFIVSSFLIYILHGEVITDFHLVESNTPSVNPLDFVDEIYHWHQIKTFAAVGLEGGYYTVEENEPSSEIFRFFAWGPFPTMFYGTISSPLGFNAFSMILINTIFFSIGVGLLAYTIRLSLIQIVMLALLFAVFPNILLYFPSVMLEMLNLLIAVYLSIAFYQLMNSDNILDIKLIILTLILLTVASLLRVSWLILYVPAFAIFGWRMSNWKGMLIATSIGVLMAVPIYILFRMFSAPYSGLALDKNLFDQFRQNFIYFFTGLAYWVLLRLAAMLVIFGVIYKGFQLLTKRIRDNIPFDKCRWCNFY